MKAVLASIVLGAVLEAPAALAEPALPPPPPPPPGALVHDWTGAAPATEAKPQAPPPADVAPASTPAPRQRWYGYQTLIIDATSSALILSTMETKSSDPGLAVLGGIGYAFGAPLVHAIHGHGYKFWRSFGLRVGAPTGLALAGAAVCSSSATSECAAGGLVLGMITAMAIDTAVIAKEDAPQPTLAVAPVLGRDRAGIAFGGTF